MTKYRTVIYQHADDAAAVGAPEKCEETAVIVAISSAIFCVGETFIIDRATKSFGLPKDGFSIWVNNPESPNCPQKFWRFQSPGSFHLVGLEYNLAPIQSILGIVIVLGLIIVRAEDATLSWTKKVGINYLSTLPTPDCCRPPGFKVDID